MKQVYLILAAVMLLCLAPMPYGYFQLVRFIAMVAFGLMAYRYYVNNKAIAAVVFGVLALLFQPIYKIALGRATWNVIDVLVAGLLIGLFVLEKRLEKRTTVGYQPLPPDDWMRLEDNEIVFRLNGKLSPKELVYVASEEDKALTEIYVKQKPAGLSSDLRFDVSIDATLANLHFLTLEDIYNAATEKISKAGCTSFAEYASNNYKSEVR